MLTEISSKNKKFWNIVKGIGILSIVIGHCCSFLVYFVYLFHLAIFFFVGGSLYNEEKYGDNPYLNLSSKIKNNWPKYIFYSILFILLHNLFLNIGVIINSNHYYPKDILVSSLNSTLFLCNEAMAGALWFIPVYIFASTLFGAIISFSRRFEKELEIKKDISIIVITLLMAVLGTIINIKNINLMLHIQTVPLVIPFFTAGYYFQKCGSKISKYLNCLALIISFIIMFIFAYKLNIHIDLSSNMLGNTSLFYFISLIGIFFCLCLAAVIQKIKMPSNIFASFGKYSFEIMAIHFTVFKIIDCIYARIKGITDPIIFGRFPYAFKELWLVYIILGVTIPTILIILIDKNKKRFTNLIRKIFDKGKKAVIDLSKTLKKNKEKVKNALSVTILLLSIIFFGWIFINSLKYESNVYYNQNKLISLGVAFIILFIWLGTFLLLKKILKKTISLKFEILILLVYFTIITIIQVFIVKNLSVIPSWDFGVIFDNAYNYVLNKTFTYAEYFEYFPNNILLLCLSIIIIKIGLSIGISASSAMIIANILCIDLAILLIYLIARKCFKISGAIFTLILVFFFLPIFLYTPIFYTDTFSIFVGLSFIYLYLLSSKVISWKQIIILIMFGLLLFYGKEMKITSLIPFIAIIIYDFLNKRKILNIKSLFIIITTFIVISSIFKVTLANTSQFTFNQTGYGSYPYTHWIMMGVEDKNVDNSGHNAVGGYNEEDYKLTRSFNTGKDAIPFTIEEFKRRVSDYKVGGYFNYLTRKSVNAWADGLLYSDVALSRKPIHSNEAIYNKLLVENSKYIFIYFSQGVEFAFLLAIIIGAMYKLKRKDYQIDILRVSLLGIMFFLLLWENRSRYLLNFLPIFILIVSELYNYKFKNIKKREIKNV